MIPGSIQPVILHSFNIELAEKYSPYVELALSAVKSWYRRELGRPLKPFLPTIILSADSLVYPNDPLEALSRAVMYQEWPMFNVGFVPYIYIGFCVGAGGYAGSVHWDEQAGLCALGDACLTAISGDSSECLSIIGGPDQRCSIDGQTGAIAHELMHGLGLGEHTDTKDLDLSSAEYQEFPRCHLPKVVKDHIRKKPWNIFLTPIDFREAWQLAKTTRQKLTVLAQKLELED